MDKNTPRCRSFNKAASKQLNTCKKLTAKTRAETTIVCKKNISQTETRSWCENKIVRTEKATKNDFECSSKLFLWWCLTTVKIPGSHFPFSFAVLSFCAVYLCLSFFTLTLSLNYWTCDARKKTSQNRNFHSWKLTLQERKHFMQNHLSCLIIVDVCKFM